MAYGQEEQATGKPADDQKLIEDDRKLLAAYIDDEDTERQKMRDDMHFCALDQWDEAIRNDREGDIENGPRPCLTVDKINQFLAKVINDMRQGRPGINVRPQDDKSDVETAKIIKGIVRNIEDQSNADIAYSSAAGNATKIGLGFMRVIPEYVDDESFDQELRIRPIPNTFSVYLGPHIMPDGSDAECCFIIEAMPIDKFKQEFPKAKCEKADFEGVDSKILGHWRTDDTVTVVEKYELEKTNGTLHILADGTAMSKEDYEAWPESYGLRPTIQKSRTTTKTQLKWRKETAVEILDRRDLPGKYIPIVEMIGRESWVDGKRILWGVVRPAKDSLRMYNYWASTITEKMGLAPKNPFIGAKGQFEGLEDRWKAANRKNFAYLEYNAIDVNGNAIPAPQRQGATPMEAAYFHFMEVIEHDVQTSLGMFKAAIGETESQQSGRAILALQRESDTGTYHFGANQGVSIRHGGRIILDLIPHYYDTKKIVRIIGEDGETQTVHLDPDQQEPVRQVQDDATGAIRNVYNPTIGKYDIAIVAGPSYNTKRMEDQAVFVEMSKGAADPASAAILRYLVMRNSDNPGAQEAAKLLKSMLPPQALQALESKQPIPPQAMAEMQKMRGAMQQMQEGLQKLQQENQQLKSGAQTTAMKIQADSIAKRSEFMLTAKAEQAKQKMESVRLAEERAARIQKLNDDKEIAVFEARLKAETAIEVAQIGAKAGLMESAVQAANQANMALTKDLGGASSEAKEEKSEAAPKMPDIHIHMPSGKKKITSPDGKVYTSEDA